MKIVLALGNAADTGGPTKYAEQMCVQFAKRGHDVRFKSYGPLLRRMPSGIRHVGYALALVPAALSADVMLGFDTMTVGAPLLLASALTRTPYGIRIGGDFVWEQYVESTGNLVKLSRFYQDTRGRLSLKQRFEIWLTGVVVRHSSALLFNSAWQRDLWHPIYKFQLSRSYIVENLYPQRKEGHPPTNKVFVAAGRPIKLKQEGLLKHIFKKLSAAYPEVSLDLSPLPPQEHQKRVENCYAIVLASVSDVSPNVIIDAVVHGKPFICTKDTGIRERLEGTGLFVDTQDEKALSDAIESLLDPEEYKRAVERVRAFSFVRTWDNVADDALSALQNI